jgi:predicted kinase
MIKCDLDKVSIPNKMLVIVRGLPSSGKTTIAKILTANQGVAISVDEFMTTPNGEYEFSKNAFIEAQRQCKNLCQDLMQSETDLIVIHNTMAQAWEAEPYFDMAREYGYLVQVMNLYDGGLTDAELASRSVHSMPIHLIQKTRQRWDIDIYPHRQRRPSPRAFDEANPPKVYTHFRDIVRK